MNIFIPSNNQKDCVISLDDKRLVKMVLETAQILSTVASLNKYNVTYKPTHVNHPCVKWTAESNDNYWWLYTYFALICGEYTYRFDKVHKCTQLLNELAVSIPNKGMTDFVNCTSNKDKGISFKHISDVHEAYRLYLNSRWVTDTRKPMWTKREKPKWASI